jgi:NhaP-type Na+/H+ or K+/H+ antiporter
VKEPPVSKKFQFVVWISGLRGAMALALALEARQDQSLKNGDVILVMTMLYSLISVLVIGSGLGPVFKLL